MAEVWPHDVLERVRTAPIEGVRAFNCLMLMPFEHRFTQIAQILKETVGEFAERFAQLTGAPELPKINRVDWITESGAIHEDIWREIAAADLVFCDITGHNPNVMFEAGVCAAWKKLPHVVFIKDRFFRQLPAFDIAPIRYIEYELTSEGVANLREKVRKLVSDAMIAFPDAQGAPAPIHLPLAMDFSSGRDDERLYTPPLAHRRIDGGRCEFGSRTHFAHSWATIGKAAFRNFDLAFKARFSNRVEGRGFIGAGFRSQHYFANFTHMVYLNYDGKIILVEPNERPPHYYDDVTLRGETEVSFAADHTFRIIFTETTLKIAIDDFEVERRVAEMPKVLGPGLIRFQSHMTWMALSEVRLLMP